MHTDKVVSFMFLFVLMLAIFFITYLVLSILISALTRYKKDTRKHNIEKLLKKEAK